MKVCDFRQHFMNNFYHENVNRKNTKKKNKLSHDFDKLFFNFLVLIHYDIPINYNKHEEMQIKYKFSHDLESFSYKNKEQIIQNLCFDNEIHLKTLNCLANYFKINLVYHHLRIFIKMLHSSSENHVYIINNNKDFYYCSPDKLEKLYELNYEICNINKPLYSITYYKVKDLYDMIKKMELEHGELKKKIDYYNHIKSYLDRILF